jgi:hypothetical protein
MEAISVHMLMTGAAKKHRDDYADFPLSTHLSLFVTCQGEETDFRPTIPIRSQHGIRHPLQGIPRCRTLPLRSGRDHQCRKG